MDISEYFCGRGKFEFCNQTMREIKADKEGEIFFYVDIKNHKKMFLPKTGTHKEISLGVNFFQVISLKLDQLLKSKK